ncbi:MAG: hypothetical protein ACRBBP_04145 [Bdellovibrionales bacterium]
MSTNNQKHFIEEPSKKHRDNVFKAVEAELLLNKKQTKSFGLYWLSGALTCVIAVVVYFQALNPVQKHTDLEAALANNLLMELAALSPDEVEIVDDLEFMDALDSLSPEELEEIML